MAGPLAVWHLVEASDGSPYQKQGTVCSSHSMQRLGYAVVEKTPASVVAIWCTGCSRHTAMIRLVKTQFFTAAQGNFTILISVATDSLSTDICSVEWYLDGLQAHNRYPRVQRAI